MIPMFVSVLAIVIAVVAGNQQYLTLYEDQDQAGTFITIEEQISDLTLYNDFFKNASSYCAVGWWVGYSNPFFNVEGGVATILSQTVDETPRCGNRVFTNFKSIRYLGNQDTDIPSISLYSKLNYHGFEALVDPEGDGSPNEKLPFGPVSYVSTGYSNWTFYDGQNLTGSSWCVHTGSTKVHLVAEINTAWPVIQSVAPGCATDTDTSNYYF